MSLSGENEKELEAQIARELGFDRVVLADLRCHAERSPKRPARGSDPLVITLFVHEAWTDVRKVQPVFSGYVTITHVPSGSRVDAIAHPIDAVPRRCPWLIPATGAGVTFAEELITKYSELDIDWGALPTDRRGQERVLSQVKSLHDSISAGKDKKRMAKVEREAAKIMRAELKARSWRYMTKARTAETVREAMGSRFAWTKRKPKKAT